MEIFLSEAETYRSCGIGHVTTFAAWIDADYVKPRAGLAFLAKTGAGLSRNISLGFRRLGR